MGQGRWNLVELRALAGPLQRFEQRPYRGSTTPWPTSWRGGPSLVATTRSAPCVNSNPPSRSIKKEPKFCRCRVCHEHFYAETIREAREACHEYPGWEPVTCFCPD
ncbi:MAG TPA: hypothetical protein ENH21_01285 [Chromatiales bacterium]|nr:hypothetical protein [Chromatiales bacterium]HEX22044.1 hypothetical protein [Chromatiales bacterium]